MQTYQLFYPVLCQKKKFVNIFSLVTSLEKLSVSSEYLTKVRFIPRYSNFFHENQLGTSDKKVGEPVVSYNIFLNKTIGTRSILLLRQPSTNRDSTYFHILLFYIYRENAQNGIGKVSGEHKITKLREIMTHNKVSNVD